MSEQYLWRLSSIGVLMGSGHRGKLEWLFIVRALPDTDVSSHTELWNASGPHGQSRHFQVFAKIKAAVWAHLGWQRREQVQFGQLGVTWGGQMFSSEALKTMFYLPWFSSPLAVRHFSVFRNINLICGRLQPLTILWEMSLLEYWPFP